MTLLPALPASAGPRDTCPASQRPFRRGVQHFVTPPAEYAATMVVATKESVAYSWAICFYM